MDRNAWETPNELFQFYHKVYDFTVDAAASAENTKLPRFWTKEQDGLTQDWTGERIWCNPPYGRGLIEPWVEKALYGSAELVVMLLPSRTGSKWFQNLWNNGANFEFLPGRVRFKPPVGVKPSSPTEDSIIVVIK